MCCMENWGRLKCTPLEFGKIDFRVEMWSVGVKNLHKDAGAQEMPHLLQDLFLKYVPRYRPLQIKNKWITKPARSTNGFTCVVWKRFFQSGPFNLLRVVQYLRPCCPAQALLHTSRTIFSACPLFLLGLWGGVVGSCICVGILLLSVPYFRLFWLRFVCGLPAINDTDTKLSAFHIRMQTVKYNMQ